MTNSELVQLHDKKKLNYIVAGEAGSAIFGQKQNCVQCGTEFTIQYTPTCPKCGIGILDTGCLMDDKLQDLENKKLLNLIVGKYVSTQIKITCVNCRAKFTYDRNKGVVTEKKTSFKDCEVCKLIPDNYHYDDCDNPADVKISAAISNLISENDRYKKCHKCGSYYLFAQNYESLMFGREPIITTIKRLNAEEIKKLKS